MKAAEEYFNNPTIGGEAHEYAYNLKVIPITIAIELAKIYAKNVAKQALKDAADNATVISKYGDEGTTQQILETEIKLP